MQGTKIVNLFNKRWEKWSSKNKAKSRKSRSWLFPMYFDNSNPFAWNQTTVCALILDHLQVINLQKETVVKKKILKAQ